MRLLLVVLTAVSVVAAACGSGRSATTTRSAQASGTTTTSTTGATAAPATTTAASVTSAPLTRPAATAPHTANLPPLPADAHVRVAMAPIWHTPSSARAMDHAALGVPGDIRGWLAPMTTKQREDLTGRVDTQVLLNDRVIVVGAQGDWAKVVVPDQPNPADRRGYPGWLPLTQLTFAAAAPPQPATEATVIALTTWLVAPADGRRVMEVSMGTRLPVRATTASSVDVTTPEGSPLRVAAGDVSVTPVGAPALPATVDDVVRVARMFEGLPYLWGGLSGFGVDCSGLTWLDYRVHGITIPRDAVAQATAGAPVARDILRPSDIVFFAKNGTVHHNGLYIGDNTMLHAPHTGTPVRTASLDSPTYVNEYQGARRFLG